MTSSDHLSVGLASTALDIKNARQFWYQVYVKEMQRHKDDADHTLKELSDPYDTVGNLFIARREGRIVGTVITTYGEVADLGYYARLYKLETLPASRLAEISLTNKLIVAPEFRCGTLALKLAVETYRQAFVDGIGQTFIDCNAHLESFFLRLGFVHHLGWVLHKDYGQVCSMTLNVMDIEHLQNVHSPFTKHFHALVGGHSHIERNHRRVTS
ncbi:MAG: hypothetical protein AB8B96_01790 [Lysobacterales bacterium]